MSFIQTALRLVCVVAFLGAVGGLPSVAADTASSHESQVHMVAIQDGTLPEAKVFAQWRLRAGEWAYNFNPEEEAAFFESEDAANRQWQQRKAELRLLGAYREKQRMDNYPAASDKADASAQQKSTQRRPAATEAIAAFFADRRVQRRHKERMNKQSLFNLSDVQGAADARAAVESEIAALWHRVESAGASDTPTDQEFLGLVERHFSHTIVNTSAVAVATASPSWRSALLCLPLVLDAEVLPFMEREVGHLHALWRLRRVEEAMPTTSSDSAELHLQLLSSTIEDSKAVSAKVVTLVEPLTDAAVSWVVSKLTATRDAIVANDESTEAKRSELKQLLKQQSVLRRVKPVLEKYSKEYKIALRRGQLPSAEGMVFALGLIAKQRFGDDVSGLLEVVPTLSTTAPVTGLLEREWRVHILSPYGMCALVTAAFTWLCEELKERCLSRVRASRLCPPGFSTCGAVGSSTSRTRQAFILVSLLELVVPPFLPVVMLLRQLRGPRMLMWSLIPLWRPGQRAICLAFVAFLIVVNYLVASVVRHVFQIIDPSVYRRRVAKIK
ncbi:hypothetical protein LSCM4_00103 [Leishmania orientalis]|uniref:Transmembrane protein n=1 Tax=Leishmania orientalis TaxID=2249476 RepID=A0A836KGH0_9TRYP|nr:hypothetical protein LSCM4_00103 [Leishmania orientalis]